MLIWCWLRDEIEMRSPSLVNWKRHTLTSSSGILSARSLGEETHEAVVLISCVPVPDCDILCRQKNWKWELEINYFIMSFSIRLLQLNVMLVHMCSTRSVSAFISNARHVCVFPQEAWTTRFTLISRKKREKSEAHGWEKAKSRHSSTLSPVVSPLTDFLLLDADTRSVCVCSSLQVPTSISACVQRHRMYKERIESLCEEIKRQSMSH